MRSIGSFAILLSGLYGQTMDHATLARELSEEAQRLRATLLRHLGRSKDAKLAAARLNSLRASSVRSSMVSLEDFASGASVKRLADLVLRNIPASSRFTVRRVVTPYTHNIQNPDKLRNLVSLHPLGLLPVMS